MPKEETEPWTGTQRSLPVLVGLLFLIIGCFVIVLAFPDIASRWEYVVWGIAMILGGAFVLYLRYAILPSVRNL